VHLIWPLKIIAGLMAFWLREGPNILKNNRFAGIETWSVGTRRWCRLLSAGYHQLNDSLPSWL
jgi:hypothetical protein